MKNFLRNLSFIFKMDFSKIIKNIERYLDNIEEITACNMWRLYDMGETLDNVASFFPVKYLVVKIRNIEVQTSGELKMAFSLKDTEEVVLTANVVDAKGNAASVADKGVWASSDETVVTLTVSEDSLSVIAASTGKLGEADVTFVVDGLSAAFAVTVVGDVASQVTITAGEPSVIPAPVEPEPEPTEPVEPETPAQ